MDLWQPAVEEIRNALVETDPARAAVYRANAVRYLAALDTLDAYVRSRAESLPPDRRTLTTAHDAFNYFGRAYGFDVYGLQEINTAAEAGTADVQELAQLIVARPVPCRKSSRTRTCG